MGFAFANHAMRINTQRNTATTQTANREKIMSEVQLHSIDEPLYEAEGREVSMKDLLLYFDKVGSMRVSDLHLKVGTPPTYRIDGILQPIRGGAPLNKQNMRALVSTVLNELELQALEDDRSVDSSYITEAMQFRMNIFYDNDGLCAAIRALNSKVPPLGEIGFPNNVWRDIIGLRHGLVLLTGITGAGKTTTIASLISTIATQRKCRIITLEDPIEYKMQNGSSLISQREVGRDVINYERGIRDCLREDPDVLFVGEMRDRESTTWALTAAETGHLVFSTLVTRDTRGTANRLIDLYPSGRREEIASQLSLALKFCITQKLLPRADGKGRVVAMEILNNTYGVANLIRMGKIEQLSSQLQTHTKDIPGERMTTMERSLARLACSGVVTAIEAEKWAADRNSFLDEIKGFQREQASKTTQ